MADQETANAGLEKVTDYVDEQELNADDTADALKNLAANPGARYATTCGRYLWVHNLGCV